MIGLLEQKKQDLAGLHLLASSTFTPSKSGGRAPARSYTTAAFRVKVPSESTLPLPLPRTMRVRKVLPSSSGSLVLTQHSTALLYSISSRQCPQIFASGLRSDLNLLSDAERLAAAKSHGQTDQASDIACRVLARTMALNS